MGVWMYDGFYVTACSFAKAGNKLIVRREDEWPQVSCARCLKRRKAKGKRGEVR